MKIRKKQKQNFIFLCLLFSVFNDWMRIPGTPISLFRLFLPAALLICFFELEGQRKYVGVGILFLVVNLFQNGIFTLISGMVAPLLFIAKYMFLYLSIFSIFLMVKWIRKTSRSDFEKLFFRVLPVTGIINILLYWLCETPAKQLLHLANRNNYAISLAAIFPYFFLKGLESKRIYFLPCILILGSLFVVGSKAAFLGGCLEILLIAAMKVMRLLRSCRWAGGVVLFSVLFSMVMVLQSPLYISGGHTISDLSTGMMTHILSSEPYPISDDSSLHYRTNSIICMLDYIKASCAMGIGAGNTGLYLAVSMPGADYYLAQQSVETERKTLSPHFALLEFISDNGIWAIALLLAILKSAWEKFMNAKENGFVDSYFVAVALSFPVWCMSASGIYTIYYLFLLFACFYEWYQMKILQDGV